MESALSCHETPQWACGYEACAFSGKIHAPPNHAACFQSGILIVILMVSSLWSRCFNFNRTQYIEWMLPTMLFLTLFLPGWWSAWFPFWSRTEEHNTYTDKLLGWSHREGSLSVAQRFCIVKINTTAIQYISLYKYEILPALQLNCLLAKLAILLANCW